MGTEPARGETRTWTKPGDLELLEKIRVARQKNIAVYARLVDKLHETDKLGWRVRRPGDPDITLLIIERSMKRSVAETKAVLQEIIENDEEVVRLSKELAKG